MVIYFLQQRKPPVVPVLQEVSRVLFAPICLLFFLCRVDDSVFNCDDLFHISLSLVDTFVAPIACADKYADK